MLYPIYVDSERTRADGRRYSKECCIANPKFVEVRAALDRLKCDYVAEPGKCHPRAQSIPGRFCIKKEHVKQETIHSLVKSIMEDREKKTEIKSKVPNLLKLVPVKKKKGKKNKQ